MDINRFLEIEKKYSLYEQSINDVNYWNYSRVQIWNYEICARKLELQESHPMKRAGVGERIKVAAQLIKNSIWRGKKGTQTDILFLAHERRTKIDGIYQCIYTEPLAESVPNSVILDMPFEYKHLRPESKLKRYYADYILIVGNIYYQIHKFFKTKHYKATLSQLQKQMKEPLKELSNSYQCKFSEEKVYRVLHRKLLVVERERKLYDRLLQKIQPKLIVEVVYYGMHGMMLNELAKLHGIPTIELQHGTMHKEHAAYQIYWDEIIPQLPDKIFLFSDFWKKQIRVPIADDNLIVTGFPYFEKNRSRYNDNSTVRTGKTILFISQGTIGDKLSRLAVEIADKLLPQGYRIIYKLHPAEISMWESNYPYLKNTGIEVVGGESRNIYECFVECDIQVGVYSTAIYEGLGFGLRTFIYNIGHADTLYELAEEGYAQIINNSNEFIKALGEENAVKKGDLFWSDDALYKMKRALENLLEKSDNLPKKGAE